MTQSANTASWLQSVSRREFYSSQMRRHGSVYLVYVLILILFLVGALVSPSFSEPANIANLFRQAIVVGLVTIGQVYVLITGGIDVSVGMIARVVGLGVAVTMGATTIPPAIVIVLGLVTGALIGLVNGLFITRVGAAPFIVTLGMMGVLSGVALAISSGPTASVPDFFLAAYSAKIGPVYTAVIVMLLVWVVSWIVLTRTSLGRALYAAGGSTKAARLAAIPVRRTVIFAYVVAGTLAALAGIFLLAKSGIGDPSLGQGLEFSSIVAAAIGGISLYGGRGSIAGAFGAVLLVSMIGNIFDHLHVSGSFQEFILGLIVLFSVSIYQSRSQK